MTVTTDLGEPVSRTNHPVYRTADGWLKAWTPDDPVRAEALRREHRVNLHLGVPSKLGSDGLRTPHLGEPPVSFDASVISAVAQAVDELPDAPEGLRGALEWERDQRGFIDRRLAPGPERDACLAHAPDDSARPSGAEARGSLVHADPHMRNVIMAEDGVARLIDWEAALDASSSVAYACLAHYVIADSPASIVGPWLAELRERSEDPAVFDWALRVRQASWLSWVFANKGADQGWRRLAMLRTLF